MEVNLMFLKKDGSFKSVPLPSNVTVLGRRHDCDLRLRLDSVSRRHCRISSDNGILNICDLKSKNGTIVNGESVIETKVNPGDKVTIGQLSFVIQVDGKPEAIEIDNPSENNSEEQDIDFGDDGMFEDTANLGLDDGDL
jgi:pSer/pThr/pTyr-binding forkhead associated (FHA) protein